MNFQIFIHILPCRPGWMGVAAIYWSYVWLRPNWGSGSPTKGVVLSWLCVFSHCLVVRLPFGPVWGPGSSSDWWSAAVKAELLQPSRVSGPLPRRTLRPLSPLSFLLECWVRPLSVGITCRPLHLDKFSFWSSLYRKKNLPGVPLLRR